MRKCGGEDKHKLYYASYYCDNTHKKLFYRLYGRLREKSWKEFKKAALEQFNGSDGRKQLYTLQTAKEIVAKRKAAGFGEKTDIIEYQQDFMACTNELISVGVSSEDKMGRMLEEGLPSKLCGDLQLRLEFKFPTHRPDMHTRLTNWSPCFCT